MRYSISKHIFMVEDNSGYLRLYNSIQGSRSLLRVAPTKKKKVTEILEERNLEKWEKDPEFKIMQRFGYVIEESFDEMAFSRIVRNDVINYPGLMLTIMPTEECNFRCEYCYENHKKGKMNKTVQDALVKFVQKNIRNYTRLDVAWFGGEPLEALNVVTDLSERLISVCKTARKNYSAGMTTNGYNLNRETFEKLLRLKVYEYQITIDGLKDTHDKYRHLKDGEGTFNKIVQNIESIRDLRRNIYKIDIRTNFTKESIKSLPQYLQFCEKTFGSDSRFSLCAHLAGNWGGESVRKMEGMLVPNDSYNYLLKSIVELNPNISFRAHLRDLDAFQCMCYAGLRNSYVIGSDGIIYKCTEDFDMSENQIGYLSENGDMIIDTSKQAKWMDFGYERPCAQCRYWGSCLGGPCPKVKINVHDKKGNTFCPRTSHSVCEIMQLIDASFYKEL